MDFLWVWLALLSAFFFAGRDIMLKQKLGSKDFTKVDALFYEYVLSFFLVMIAFWTTIEFTALFDIPLLLLAKTVLVIGLQYFYFMLLQKYEISLVSPLLNLSPIVLVFLSAIILSEQVTLLQMGGIVLIIISTYFLEVVIGHHSKKQPHNHHMMNLKKIFKTSGFQFYFLTVLLLFILSFLAIVDKILVSQITVQTNLFYTAAMFLVGVLFVYKNPFTILHKVHNLITSPSNMLFSLFAFFSVFFILSAFSIPAAMVSLVIPIRRTSTLFTAIYGGFLFHEKHLVKKAMAIMIMLVGVLLIVL